MLRISGLAVVLNALPSNALSASGQLYLDSETVYVVGSGHEAFTTLPLAPGQPYRVTVRGTVNVGRSQVDGLYRTDDDGNFLLVAPSFLISFARESGGEKKVRASLVEERRADHTYVLDMAGEGERVSARLDRGSLSTAGEEAAGRLRITFERAPQDFWRLFWSPVNAGEIAAVSLLLSLLLLLTRIARVVNSPEARQRRAQLRAKAEQERRTRQAREAHEAQELARRRREEEERQQRRTRAERQAELQRRALEEEIREEAIALRVEEDLCKRFTDLCLAFQMFPHFEDPKWIDAYARKYKSKLLSERNDILVEHFRLRNDTRLLERLEQNAPHILRRVDWRIEALGCAEKLDVEPVRTKETPDEFRARSVRRIRVLAKDHIERAKERIDLLQEYREELAEYVQRGELDQDEMDRAINEFKEMSSVEDEKFKGTLIEGR
jgi:hypothetical protein